PRHHLIAVAVVTSVAAIATAVVPSPGPARASKGASANRMAAGLPAEHPGASPAPAGTAGASARPAGIAAAGGELADAATGTALWSRGRYGRRPIASITKIMTALVVLRAGDLARRIKVTAADVRYVRGSGASGAGLHAGDVLTARQLLEGMLLPSGADAARALATAYGPGWPRFVRRMNAL